MRTLLSLILISLFLFIKNNDAQSHPYEVKFSHQIENGVSTETLRPSRAGLLYSLIGDYHTANSYSDFPISWGVDSLDLDSFDVVDALPLIITEAKKHQIVIISENHLKPQHRIFAKKIINELSKFGFNHFGLETFSSTENSNLLLDTELIERGYPLDSQMTGIYSLEPNMGELVRDAINHNYTFFAYERSQKIEGKDRDEIQADNIVRYLNLHPGEKVIILCGFHHVIESDLPKRGNFKWMAKHLKDKMGINPLTIYQDNFTEKFIEDEHPYLCKMSVLSPSLFVDNNMNIVPISEHVDIEVIHPKTIYKNGRANWLYENEDYRVVPIKKDVIELNYPIIASAYRKGEVNSVPVDRIEIKHKYGVSNLVLKSGTYRINLFDGEAEFDYEIVLEDLRIKE